MPLAVSFAAKLVLKHANERTRNGIKIYSNVDEIEIVNKDELPVEFGGKVPMQPIIGKKMNF